MKETGMVRRIDELGRVVIPKEIRKTLRLKESDPIEIFTDRDMLCFKKYSPINALNEFGDGLCSALSDAIGCMVAIVDGDKVIYAHGSGSNKIVGLSLNENVVNVLKERQAVLFDRETYGEVKKVVADGEYAYPIVYIAPCVAGGDIVGGVVVCSDNDLTSEKTALIDLSADILARQF